ncbi:hypothetical protein PIB30_011406 [Stylosanthes scabra]|uniref:Uncharacterized protein n=1 Tax=Stylosanthes scabra TaxID=79078 RepID=A0ABU6Z5F0_9FABA|nr:hypothetical protein [Stylosanthes scabra]
MRKEVEQNSAATMTGETTIQLEAKRSSKTEIRRQDCTVKLEADGSWTMRKEMEQSSVTTMTEETATRLETQRSSEVEGIEHWEDQVQSFPLRGHHVARSALKDFYAKVDEWWIWYLIQD